MSKHTPGPWAIYDIGEKSVRISGKDWIYFAKVFVAIDGERDSEGEANARLIAAAPELLEAAEWCIALCEEIGATETNAYASAKSAIAKATGADQ